MSRSEGSKHGLVCPRCRSGTIEVLTNSPAEGVWTIYSCKTCLYAWRSTEPEENTDPEKYPEPFRLKPEDLAKFPVVPTIPPCDGVETYRVYYMVGLFEQFLAALHRKKSIRRTDGQSL